MDISLQNITGPVVAFLHRFHIVIFVVITIGSLAAAILALNSVVLSSGESNGYVSTSNNADFDQTTINQINQLKMNNENTSSSLPQTGRTNPFVEQ